MLSKPYVHLLFEKYSFPEHFGGNKRSHILKQTSTLELQGYLRTMYYVFEPPGIKGLNKLFQVNFQI